MQLSRIARLDFCNALWCLYCYVFAVKCLKLCIKFSYNHCQYRILKHGVPVPYKRESGALAFISFLFHFPLFSDALLFRMWGTYKFVGPIEPVW